MLESMVDILHRNVSLLSSLRLALLGSLELPPQLVWGQLILVKVVHVGCRIGMDPEVLDGGDAGADVGADGLSQPKQTLEAGVDDSSMGVGLGG